MFNPEALKNIVVSSGVSFRENSKSYIFTCPRCNKRSKLYINKLEGYFCCFKCKEHGFKGRPELALSEICGLPIDELSSQLHFKETVKLERFVQLDLSEYFDYEESAEELEPVLKEMVLSPNFVDHIHPTFQKGREYLIKERGLTEELIRFYDIRYSPSEECVVFPVKINDKLVGWQLRHINKAIKLTSKGLEKENCLMFQDQLINSPHCVLAEGPISAIHAHLCGGNVASMGKDVSSMQLKIIKKRVKKLYLALDPDATTTIDRICRELYGEIELRLLMPAEGYEDIGAMPLELVYEQFKKAPLASEKKLFHFKDTKELIF